MRKTLKGAALAAISLTCLGAADAGDYQYIGDVILNGSSFCPRNTLPAEGQTLDIASYQALYSLVGTMYGGNGISNFNLPDLRGRIPMGRGTTWGGGPTFTQGQAFGTETRALSGANLYTHNHALQSANEDTDTGDSTNAMLGDLSSLPSAAHYYHAGPVAPDEMLDTNSISTTGQSQPFENRQPIIAMRWCIYINGDYPPRS